MSKNDAFGPIVTGVDVEEAIMTTLKTWVPTYLAEIVRARALAAPLPNFRTYTSKLILAKAQEDQMPACVVVAPGTMGDPVRHAGKMDVIWSVGVGCIASGQNINNTYDLARYYVAAVRAVMMQKSDLGGFARGVNFISERYDELNTTNNNIRTMAAGIVHLGVEVGNITDANRGPSEVPVDPAAVPPDLGTVQSVDITIEEVDEG